MKARTAFFVAITIAALSPHQALARQAAIQSIGSVIDYERRAAAIERVAEAAAQRAAVAASVFITDNWWDTRAGRQQYAKLRLEGFDKDLMRFERFGIEPWPSTYDDSSGQWIVPDIENRSKELEEATSGVIDFVEWLLNVKAGDEPVSPQGVDVQVRLERIQQIAARVRPRIIEVATGDSLDVLMFVEVLQDLSEVRMLARTLRD